MSEQGQGAAGQGSGAPAAAPNPWGELPADLSGFVQNKGWQSPVDALKSYVNLERLRGVPETELLRIPKENDAAGWDAVYGRLRPGKVEDYGIEGADAELLAKVHEAGLSKQQAQRLAEYLGTRAKTAQEQSEQAKAQRQEADMAALKTEWGGEYDANVEAGKRAARALGWDAATIDKLEDALGTRGVYELAARLGRGLREDGFAGQQGPQSGQSLPFGMTPQAAGARLQQMQNDPAFQARLYHADKGVRLEAMKERDAIASLAYPEER
jgi:hypothetical protein